MDLTTRLRQLNWPLVLGLGAVGLIRPLATVTGLDDLLGRPATPLLLTAAITAVWVLVVGTSRVREPVLTLVVVGLVYAAASIVLSGVLSPILTGELQGPLAMPFAIVPVLLVNAVWGLLAGVLALLVQRARGVSGPETPAGVAEAGSARPAPGTPESLDR
ncbi:MAG: hypothetical protein ACRCYR_10500 [Phycicoccus sp.]